MSVKLLPLTANPDNNLQIEILGFDPDDYFVGIIQRNGCLYAQVETYDSDADDEDEEEFRDLIDVFN